MLATSREPLGVPGETVWPAPPLEVPDGPTPGRSGPPGAGFVARLGDAPAVRLFVERASAAAPGFTLTAANAAAVAEVCRRLDGLPLALELAAARVRGLGPADLVARLDDRLGLLDGGRRAGPPRQQTLRATLDWSYDLLDEQEQVLFDRLAVFAGGFDLAAVEAAGAGGTGAPDGAAGAREAGAGVEERIGSGAVAGLLARLVDRSLVVAEAGAPPPGAAEAPGAALRYRLLETVRQYAAERLDDRGRAAGAVRGLHAAHYTALAEQAAPGMVGHDQVHWLRRLALEHDNFRAALEWCRVEGDGAAGLRLAAALGRYWHLHGPSSEGRAWLRHALAHGPLAPSPDRALALNWAGRLATVNGEADDRDLLEQSVALAEEAGDLRLLALARRHLSMAAQRHGDEAGAQAALAGALDAARQGDDRREEAFALVSLGAAALQAGDPAAAVPLLDEGLAIGREVGDAGPVGWALSVLGAIAAGEGRHGEAARLFGEALELSRPVGYWAVTVAALAQLGALERARGDLGAARRYGRACIRAAQQIGDLGLVAAALAFFGDLELEAGRDERGVRLLSAEGAWRTAPGAGPAPARRAGSSPSGAGPPPTPAPPAPAWGRRSTTGPGRRGSA